MNKQTNYAFTGVFIPAHIWANPQMCWLDKVVWAVIDTWHNGDHMCSASDQQIADSLGDNEMAVSAAILRLQGLDIVHTSSDEHGERILWTVNIVLVERQAPKEDTAAIGDVQRIVDIYNECCKSLPRAEKLTPPRVRRIRSMIKDGETEEGFRFNFLRVQNSDFLSGRSGRWTGCSIDWVLAPSNWTKIQEGIYDSRVVAQTRQLPENMR